METPPTSTLSTPSPTELHDNDPVAAELEKSNMLRYAAQQQLKPIFLVVATTPCLRQSTSGGSTSTEGIGLNGELPWPSVKADMQFFKNVTQARSEAEDGLNTAIMGRKTYFSIPSKFRPLDQRDNTIITRSAPSEMLAQIKADFEAQQSQACTALEKKFGSDWQQKAAEIAASTTSIDQKRLRITQADINVETLESGTVRVSVTNAALPSVTVTNNISTAVGDSKGRISCIGGAEIYDAFLKDIELRPRLRILQTEIQPLDRPAFECDTFWPEDLHASNNGWIEVGQEETESWTGIQLPQGHEDWCSDQSASARLRVRGWKQREV